MNDMLIKWIYCFIAVVGFQVVLSVVKFFINKTQVKDKKDYHILRRFQHMTTGIILIICMLLVDNVLYSRVFIFGGFFICFIMKYLRKNKYLNQIFLKIFSELIRKEETENKKHIASVYFMLGALICVIVFDPQIANLAILYLSFGDPIASLVGIKYGKHKLYGEKSIIGNIACSFVCAFSTLIYLNFCAPSQNPFSELQDINKLFIGLVTGSLAEALPSSPFVDDNLSIPLYSGTILTLIHKFIVNK